MLPTENVVSLIKYAYLCAYIRSPLILVTNWHQTFQLNICLLENKNLWVSFKAVNSKTRLSPNHTTYIASTIAYMVVSMFDWIFLGSSVSDRALLRVLIDSVLFRVPSDRVLFKVLSNRVPFRVLSDRVLVRVFLSVLSDSILCKVLSPRFLVCRVPSFASTTWGEFAMIFYFKHSIAT